MDYFKPSLAGTPRARLERTNAHKSIEFDVSGSVGRSRRPRDAGFDFESRSLPREDLPEGEFRIDGMRDVEQANNALRPFGLLANVAISSELWQKTLRPSPEDSPVEGGPQPHWMRQDSLLYLRDEDNESPGSSASLTLESELPRLSSAGDRDIQSPAEGGAEPVKRSAANDNTAVLRDNGSAKAALKLADVVGQVIANKGTLVSAPQRTVSEPLPRSPLGPATPESLAVRKETKVDTIGRSLSATLVTVDSREPVGVIASPSKQESRTSARSVRGNPIKEQAQGSNNFTRPGGGRCTRPASLQAGGSLTLKLPPAMNVSVPRPMMSTSEEWLGSLAPDFNLPTKEPSYSSDSDRESSASEDAGSERESDDPPEVRPPAPDGEPQQLEQRIEPEASGTNSPHAESNTFVIKEDRNGEAERVDVAKVGQNPDPELSELQHSRSPLGQVSPKAPWIKGGLLGSGSYGSVYDAVDSDGNFFAVKEVSLVEQDKQAQASVDQLMQEIDLLSQFKHENIVQYLGTERAHGKLYIFLELVSQGSLATVCRKIKLSESQISNYTRQILEGLKYLHDRRIVHRDIKCANILVDTRVCKLADFGMAKQISSLDANKSCKGSAYWMAPEVINPKKIYGPPSDIWSLGCSILEMATQSPPFGEMEWLRVLWHVGNENAPPIPDSLSPVAKDFIKRCLDVNPSKRSTAAELLNHEFVRHTRCLASASSSGPSIDVISRDLQPITEENSKEVAGLQSSQGSTALVNGNSNRVQS